MLEPPKAAPPISAGSPDTTRIPEIPMPEFRRPMSVEAAPPQRTAPAHAVGTASAPTIAGPSLLGLDAPSENKPSNDALDSLRDRSFSGLDYFYEPEEKRVSGRQILLLLVLLGALGAAGWWTYKNYLGAITRPARPTVANSVAGTPADNASPKTETPAAATPEPPAATAPVAPAPASTAAGTAEANGSSPAVPPPATSSTGEQKPSVPAAKHHAEETVAASTPKPVPAAKPAPMKTARVEAQPPVTPASEDNGDAAYRKAQSLLYGQGGAAVNCDEAVKYLKEASARQNAKARSTFGTMYATGHCVPRDLPTSYSWFALALHVDPNNQILEKDLTAVWNQMTPPERQIATKMKP